MTAVTADQLAITQGTPTQALEGIFPIKTSQTVYVGTMCNFAVATGRVKTAASEATAGLMIAGRCTEIINESGSVVTAGTGNTAGTIKARIVWNDLMLLGVRTAIRTFASLGKTVFVSDNVTVGGTAAGGTALARVQAGMLVAFATSGGQVGSDLTAKSYAYVKLRDCTGAIIAV
jgi:hypothetical protein